MAAGTKPILGVLILLLLPPSLSTACELRMGWEPWKPYQYQDTDGHLKGLDIELMRAMADQAGCELTLVEQPWKRHLRNLKKGRVDIAAGADYSPERADYAYFSRPYRTESVDLFMRRGEADNYELKGLRDIRDQDLVVGVTRGYDYGKQFETMKTLPGFEEHIEPARSDLLNYRKLARKRLDAFLADPLVLKAQVRGSTFEGAFEAHPLRVKQAPIYLMFSRESTSKELVQRFNKALATITQTGLYDRILNTYKAAR
ncbi:substrate-binding periplasmic protein [Halomonadaceae bacterium KBTZ08]